MKITLRMLKSKGACGEGEEGGQVEIFKATFPNGCEVTAANIKLAATSKLNMCWFAENFFSAAARAEYCKVCDTDAIIAGCVAMGWIADASA